MLKGTIGLLAACAIAGATLTGAQAADLPSIWGGAAAGPSTTPQETAKLRTGYTDICGRPLKEVPIFFYKDGRPTPIARTPYFYCVTGRTLTRGSIPPTMEYCCG